MPSQTPRQHRAMEAAEHGHSKLGIPKKVGAEFAAADEAKTKKPANEARRTILAKVMSTGQGYGR